MNRTCATRWRLVVAFPAFLVLVGCVYYNTFFNARRAYEEAERARVEQTLQRQRTQTIPGTAQPSPSSAQRTSTGRQAPTSAAGGNSELYRTAIEKSAKVLAYYPTSNYVDDALLLMAKAYYRLEEFTASLRKCDELLTSFPESPLAPETRYWRGMALWKLGEREEAVPVLRHIADDEKSPFRGDAAFAFGELERRRGALDEAIRYYRVAITKAVDPLLETEARKALGECLVEANRPAEAVTFYRELATVSWATKDRYAAHVRTAAAQRMMGDYDGAVATLKPLITDERYNEFIQRTRIEIALTQEEKGELEAAVLLYQEVLDEAERQAPASVQRTASPQPDQPEQAPRIPQTSETVEANYRLGLIQEKRYHNYATAAEHYALAAQNQTLDAGKTAGERQGYITRWNELHAALADTADSTGTQARDLTLYTLAEHFLLKLDEPDSAFAYLRAVVENFPEGRLALKAQYALGWLWLNVRNDTTRADSAWQPILADTTEPALTRGLQRDIRAWLGTQQPDPALPAYREAEAAWLDALDLAPPHVPDSLARDSLARIAWWDRWAEEQRTMSERYVPKLQSLIEEYPDSPYATRARFVLGWTAENVMEDTSAARRWYREASRDTLVLADVAERAEALLDLRAEPAGRASAQPDSASRATSVKGAAADSTSAQTLSPAPPAEGEQPESAGSPGAPPSGDEGPD